MSPVASIQQKLQDSIQPEHLRVVDQSHLHAGHAAVKAGAGGHFAVEIVAGRFDSMSRVQRHRILFEVLDSLMGKEIHALAIRAYTPAEWQRLATETVNEAKK